MEPTEHVRHRNDDNTPWWVSVEFELASTDVFDSQAWWFQLHTSGLSAGAIKAGDVLLVHRVRHQGLVRISQDWLGICSASASGHHALKKLMSHGLLRKHREAGVDEPTIYQMTATPQNRQGTAAPVTKNVTINSKDRVTFLAEEQIGHDAHWSKTGSLASAYPVLSLVIGLAPQVLSVEDLGTLTRSTARVARLKADFLVSAGILTVTGDVYRLTDEPLEGLLGKAAAECGLTGRGLEAREQYRLRCEKRAEERAKFRHDMQIPGTDAWMWLRIKELCITFETAEPGSTDAEILGSFGGDVQLAAEFRARRESDGLLGHPSPQ